MKKYIGNKLYDTDTAERLGSWSTGGTKSKEAELMRETLYRKRTGEYFLHGEGGGMTQYGKATGQNQRQSGEEILPMSYDAAKRWAEVKLTENECHAIFDAPIKDKGVKKLIALDAQTVTKLDRLRSKTGKTYGEIIAELSSVHTKLQRGKEMFAYPKTVIDEEINRGNEPYICYLIEDELNADEFNAQLKERGDAAEKLVEELMSATVDVVVPDYCTVGWVDPLAISYGIHTAPAAGAEGLIQWAVYRAQMEELGNAEK